MQLLDAQERTTRGQETHVEVTGSYVMPPATLFAQSWGDFVFSEIWTRPGLDRRSRYLIALAGAASSNGPTEAIDGYAYGALKSGLLTLAELREAALHLAVYSGWSRGAELDRAVTQAAQGNALEPARLPPIREGNWNPEERIAHGIAEFEKVMTFPGPPPITPYFEAGIDNFVFGEMWGRPGLDQRSRRWITLVGVCDSATEVPMMSHIHAAMASGNCTYDEMLEFVLQYAVHAGWPKASYAQGFVMAMGKKVAAGLPYDG